MGHLKEIKKSWFQHFIITWKFIIKLIIHSFFPNMFLTSSLNDVVKKTKPKKEVVFVPNVPEPTMALPPTPEVREKKVLVYTSRNS